MIDSDGFRPNVGIIVANDLGQVLWARRVGQDAWLFPQGGINAGESTEEALYRELKEEVGLCSDQVAIIGVIDEIQPYKLGWERRLTASEVPDGYRLGMILPALAKMKMTA